MSVAEFDCIKTYFTRDLTEHADVICGVGDDAAVINVPNNQQLVVSTDTLIEGVHFPENAEPKAIGHQALAVNVSDCAAMGATPRWASLALTIPAIDDAWLTDFSAGFFALADQYPIALIGGDLTQGPLSITMTIHGLLAKNKGLYRHAAHVGDGVYVTGTLGAAGAAAYTLHYPQPQIAAGQALLDIAHAAIDISDGFAQDLQHILTASDVGARIELEKLPVHSGATLTQALTAGEDYQLCFTASESAHDEVLQCLSVLNIDVVRVGVITEERDLHFIDADGHDVKMNLEGYRHFENKHS